MIFVKEMALSCHISKKKLEIFHITTKGYNE